jgi:NAD(P)H-nitrite reductase large subunit
MRVETYDYAIVGNSAAAINACDAIRSRDTQGSIAVFCEEKYRCYSRPLISYLVAGEVTSQGMYYRPSNYYRSMKVGFRAGERVVSITPSKKLLVTESKEKVKWHKLLLATGFTPFVPAIEGLQEVPYLTFVSWDDAKRMLSLTKKSLSALVVGAGLIGIKAAEALQARGALVTVVEKMDRVLPLALDERASGMVEERCAKKNIQIVSGVSVSSLISQGGNKGRATLEDGSEIDFDLLIMAVGVRPRVELAEAAGLSCDGGIDVDEHQRTSAKDVYAAGDAVRAMDIVLGKPAVNALWPVAALQGKYAGRNMAGEQAPYPGCNSMNAVEFFGLPVLSAGIVNPPDSSYQVITRLEPGDYRKVILAGDVIVGMLMAGKIERAGILTSLIQEKANVKRIKNCLLDEGFGHINFPRSVRHDRIMDGLAGLKSVEAVRSQGG